MTDQIHLPPITGSVPAMVAMLTLAIVLLLPVAAAGAASCIDCHAAVKESLSSSPHGTSAAAPDGAGCTICHGAAQAHLASPSRETIDRIIDKTPAEQEAICHQCHRGMQKSTNHPTTGAGIGCVNCHGIHKKKKPAEHAR
jgi:hypothetical protein